MKMQNLILHKTLLTSAFLLGVSLKSFAQQNSAEQLNQLSSKLNQNSINFTENKGQVTDQNNQARPDVLFGGQNNGLVFHLRNNGISYQLSRIDKWKQIDNKFNKLRKKESDKKVIDQSTVYRVDINWLNTNKNALILSENESVGFNNYYLPNGDLTVKSYEKITYQNLYKGIDLKWYEKEGELKYDYVCAAGANYKKIEMQIEGADELSLNQNGELIIKTPLGTIIEKAPVVFQNGKTLNSHWLLESNILSFEIENLNGALPYIIDPVVRVWGTYYGGSGQDAGQACATDASGNIYLAGYTDLSTSTIIATTGAHQATISAFIDAFLVKFNSSGVRQWGTYYGGTGDDFGRAVAVDATGNVYMSGITSSTVSNVIATTGAHQAVAGGTIGAYDAFLVKFNSSGVRQWGTYYGDANNEEGYNCVTDGLGNIYMSGVCESSTGTIIASAGSHQSAFGGSIYDGFLVKFNTNGVRQWGTYYGGTSNDIGYDCSIDASNNVYLSGLSGSTNLGVIASGGHQNTMGGFLDAFLVKFNSSGVRQWGTYYGGTDFDTGYACETDGTGNVYLAGATSSTNSGVIATSAAHQTVNGGAANFTDDAFLVKFNSSGVRQWGTFYGGDDIEEGNALATDASNNVYLVGATSSTLSNAIATAASHQTALGAPFETNAYITMFNTSGIRQFGSYYGLTATYGYGCATYTNGNIYLCGQTTSTIGSFISTAGSHQTSGGGTNSDAFLVQFIDCSSASPGPTNTSSPSNLTICAGNSVTLSATAGTATISWYATSTSTAVLGTGTAYITPTLSAGSYTYYAGVPSCGPAGARTGIAVLVNASPTISVNAGVVCHGQSFTITPAGASTYTVLDSNSMTITPTGTNFVVSPTSTSSMYIVGGTSANGCNAFPAFITFTVNPSPTISVNSGAICPGATFTIIPSGANSYTIQGGTATVSPLSSTNYSVIGSGTNGCVSASATCTLTVDAIPTIAISNGTVCSGKTFTFAPTGVSSFTVQGVTSTTVNPTTNTTYTLTGSSPAGCLSQNAATCSVVIAANPTVTANSGSVCAGQSFTIAPTGAVTYSLLDNAGNPYTSNLVVSPSITTNYLISGTGANGCVSPLFGLGLVTVTVNLANISVNSGTICSGNSFTIIPNGGDTYSVQGGNYVVSPSTSTNYSIVGSNSVGCLGTATSSVTVNTANSISAASGTICSGSSFTISPTGASSYSYSPTVAGSYTLSNGQLVVSPTVSTTYTISGNSVSCSSIAQTTAIINVSQPDFSIPSNYTVSLSNSDENVSIGIQGKDANTKKNTWEILPPGKLSLNGTYITGSIKETTTFTLTQTNSLGCKTSKSIFIYYTDIVQLYTLNYFSPNGDGNNDYWGVNWSYLGYGGKNAIAEFPVKVLNIFNDQFNLVYTGNENLKWDGKGKDGKDLPAGNYYYWFVLPAQKGVWTSFYTPDKPYSGTVTLSR